MRAPPQLRDLLHIIEWDLMRLRGQKMFIAMRTFWFVLQVLVFARAISSIVKPLTGVDYYEFYLLGVFTSLLYSVGISRGYNIADEFDDGIVEYHLSLPIKRSVLAIGRIIGGAITAMLFTLPMYFIILVIVGAIKYVLAVVMSITWMFVFSVSAVAFVVIIVMSAKSTDATDILLGAIDAFVIRLSTVFYPLPIIMATGIAPYYLAALLNPISHFADFLRLLFLPEYIIYTISPTAMIVYLVGLGLGLLSVAIEFYVKKLEAGGWR